MKSNIDKLAKEKLYNYQQTPPDDAWLFIQANIKKKKTYFIAPFLWRGMAATIALLISFGTGYFVSFKQTSKLFTQTKEEIAKELYAQNEASINVMQLETDESSELKTNNNEFSPTKKYKKETVLPFSETTTEIATLTPIMRPELAKLEQNRPVLLQKEEPQKLSPQELMAMQSLYFEESEPDEKNKNAEKKWGLGGQVAPAYSYREMKNNQSDLASSYYNSVEKALLTFSGGVSLNLELSNRIVMESGLNYAQFGQSTDLLYAQANPNQSSSYEVATSAGVIIPRPASIGQISGGYSYVDALGNIINPNAEIIQNFSYLEIPLNARFKLIDKKMSFWLVGGVNTDILMGNKVYFKENNDKMFIGKTENLNTFRYSTNLKISFDYAISKKLNFNVEPGLKYSLTPINKNPEIDNYPYSFGLSTGFVYKF